MPQISSFLGIIIQIFYNDHNPPHFHALYGEYQAVIDIDKLEITDDYIPSRVFRFSD